MYGNQPRLTEDFRYMDEKPDPHEEKVVEIADMPGWYARRSYLFNHGYWIWTITAPNGNEVLEINDISNWTDHLAPLTAFLLAAAPKAREIEDNE